VRHSVHIINAVEVTRLKSVHEDFRLEGQVKAVSESAAVAASFYAQGGELRQLMYGVVTASSEPKVWASDMEWYDDADHLPDGPIYRLIATCEVNTLDLEVEVFDA
jgi:hypothetical protein